MSQNYEKARNHNFHRTRSGANQVASTTQLLVVVCHESYLVVVGTTCNTSACTRTSVLVSGRAQVPCTK